MLTLSRKPGQALLIGSSVRLTVISVTGKEVRLGIEAPREVVVWREEMATAPPVRRGVGQPSVTANDLELLANLASRLEADAHRSSLAGDRAAAERDHVTVAHLQRLRQTLASAPASLDDPLIGPAKRPDHGPPRPPRT